MKDSFTPASKPATASFNVENNHNNFSQKDAKSSVKPVLPFYIHTASTPEVTEDELKPENKLSETARTPELIPSVISTNPTVASKKSYKNPNLNILIPPVSVGKPLLGLSPADNAQDPITPIFQIVHTPTTAPGAPGPGDPEEICRLEESWAESMSEYGQISPAFPNFHPPTFSEFPVKYPYESLPNFSKEKHLEHNVPPNAKDSCALREMFALTASAKTPTFPPPSLTLEFGKTESRKHQE